MFRTSSKAAIAITIGLGLAAPSAARGASSLTITTPSLTPDPDGYLYCTVEASGTKPIAIVATVMTDASQDVTEFGTSFRASPAASGDGLYHAEETAGSLNDLARYCKASVTGARRRDVHVSLTAYDVNGNPTATVEGR